MKERIANLFIGVTGTAIADLSPDKLAAVFAGVATGAWMFYQLGAAIYDRCRRK